MIPRENLKKIKGLAEEFFKRTGFQVEIALSPEEGSTLPVSLTTDEPQILIGEGGQTLAEIQHLLRVMMRKVDSEPFFLDLDINDYKKKKRDYLRELARSTADEVSLYKKAIQLSPMTAADRRVIHMELVEREGIASESIGEGPERRVVVSPKDQAATPING